MDITPKTHLHWQMKDEHQRVIDALIAAGVDVDYSRGCNQVYIKFENDVIVIHDGDCMSRESYNSMLVRKRITGEIE